MDFFGIHKNLSTYKSRKSEYNSVMNKPNQLPSFTLLAALRQALSVKLVAELEILLTLRRIVKIKLKANKMVQ